jgi:peptidoglycan/xylan/chitin deacetylase (PgdA/CDA1 family)
MGKTRSIRPLCILTFDDGWKDFYEFAYPMLKRNQVPATVFLPTGYIGTDNWFWTDRLARFLAGATPPTKPEQSGIKPDHSLVEKIAGLKGGYEDRLEEAVSILKNRSDKEVMGVVEELEDRGNIGTVPVKRMFLNWEEVREMGKSGFVSFGSHTHNHRILVHLNDGEIREELVLSKNILLREGVVDPSFIPFCYPNGNWNERIADMVQEAGYHAAVSTVDGWNDGDVSSFELKRVAIHQDMTASREMFGCRVADIL